MVQEVPIVQEVRMVQEAVTIKLGAIAFVVRLPNNTWLGVGPGHFLGSWAT